MNMNEQNSFIYIRFRKKMGLFSRKKKVIIGNICPKCQMQFSDPQRTLRHMEKAHKSKKKSDCNTCGFRN